MANSQVEQIKERLSIIDVVGGYVELHKAGKHHKGKSPFVNEKTPSFFVSPDRGMYYCFSSQKGGDMFTFIQEMEGVDFKGALKILAEKAGVELVPEDPKKRDERETQYALLAEATEFFFKTRVENNTVTKYVEDRGVKGETQHIWKIGYAPDEWRALRSHLQEKKYNDEQMLKAGLIKHADGGKEPYDVFRDRVMFPISDASGRVVAFSGRTLKKEDGVPKYVNSPETELFQKSEILYGYDKAKNGIRHYDFSLVVEGQFDVVLSHQAGYTNAVAVSGTAFTEHHVMLLSRLSNRAVLALDADRAGISAVKRSGEIMLKKGMDVKVAHMPDGKDPADIISEEPKNFKKIIGEAKHVVEFLLDILKETSKDDRTYKLRSREEILPLVLMIPNRIDREYFENVVAEKTGTTQEAIHYELQRLSEERKIEPRDRATDTDVRVAGTKKEISRKKDVYIYLEAITQITDEKVLPLVDAVTESLSTLLGQSAREELLKGSESILSKTMFTTEKYFETLSAKQIQEEVSDRLTELSHLLARERLSLAREKINKAEEIGDHESVIKYINETKEAQALLQKNIEI